MELCAFGFQTLGQGHSDKISEAAKPANWDSYASFILSPWPTQLTEHFRIWNERDFQEIPGMRTFFPINWLILALKTWPPVPPKVIHRHFHQLLALASFGSEPQVLSYGTPPRSDEV
jgi:hypothetical protein